MSAFARGMQLGQQAWNAAEDSRIRQEVLAMRKAQDARDAELHDATMEEKRRARAREDEVLGIRREIQDYQQGIDRQATNAALDADFEAANQAALRGLPVPPVRGGSNAANEQALTVRNAVDPNSLQYQVGLNRLLQRYATVSGDVTKAAELAAQGRLLSFQEAMNAQRQQFANMTPEERAAFMERVTENAALPLNVVPVANKGGKGGMEYMVWVEGRPRIRVDEATLSDIYAAGNLMGQYGDLARDFLSKGNDKIRQLFKDYVDVTDKVMGRNYDATRLDLDRQRLALQRWEAQARVAAAGRPNIQLIGTDANGQPVYVDVNRLRPGADGRLQLPAGVTPMRLPQSLSDAEKIAYERAIEQVAALPPDAPPGAAAEIFRRFRLDPQRFMGDAGLPTSSRFGGGTNPPPPPAPSPAAAQATDPPMTRRQRLQQAYDAWQKAKGPWWMPTPWANSEAEAREREYMELLSKLGG